MEITDQYNDKIMEAVTLAESQPETPSDEITLSTGVVLKRKRFSPLRIQDILSKFKYPDMPEIYDKENKRWLKNPDDPIYIEQCRQIDAERGLAAIDAMIAFGTELLHKPDALEAIEGEGWVADNELFGLTFNPKSKVARYLSWIKAVAIEDEKDIETIAQHYAASMGISEQGVSEKVNSFQS